MRELFIQATYLAASVLFILGLKSLTRPDKARHGMNLLPASQKHREHKKRWKLYQFTTTARSSRRSFTGTPRSSVSGGVSDDIHLFNVKLRE